MAIELTREKLEAARVLLDHPLIKEIFEELEKDAIESALSAGPMEHELRLARVNEAKVIRSVRQNLLSLKARGEYLSDAGASE
jgi:CMP-N-acetylneuraminic acid synthetase